MNKMMRSVVALLLVFGCTNNVVFAVEAEDRTIPESLIGVDVEAADLIERVEVTSENCIKLRDENDISEAKKVITLSDMAYMVLDDSKNVIDDSLIWLRATTSVYWSVDANVLKKADRPGVKSCVSEIRQSQEEVR